MAKWVFPCNVNYYDVFSAFNELKDVEWRQNVNLSVGDEVFIYCSKPYSKIMFRTIVDKTEIPFEDVNKKAFSFYTTNNKLNNLPKYGYAKLSMVKYVDSEELHLNNLVRHGLVHVPQGPMRISNELYEYLMNAM